MIYYDRAGAPWSPSYLDGIDQDACIGCGRCYKVCGRSVLAPVQRPDADDDDEGAGGMIMSVASPGSCVGCGACGRTCAKRAQTYVAV